MYVLSERFCQDLLENWLGSQRSLGSRKDDLMVDFGYNDNNIKNDKHLKPISNGNIANTSMIALLEEPLPCRKT